MPVPGCSSRRRPAQALLYRPARHRTYRRLDQGILPRVPEDQFFTTDYRQLALTEDRQVVDAALNRPFHGGRLQWTA